MMAIPPPFPGPGPIAVGAAPPAAQVPVQDLPIQLTPEQLKTVVNKAFANHPYATSADVQAVLEAEIDGLPDNADARRHLLTKAVKVLKKKRGDS